MNCEKGRLKYPYNPGKYRRINKQMDEELKWYRSEIERRFKLSEMRDYVMDREGSAAKVLKRMRTPDGLHTKNMTSNSDTCNDIDDD